ncbi:hypothetical protein H4S02_007368 [Coemansia sp. RSA 2611]|nr:hypothetical protein H4S01_005173 [Coemansia sp. RSA 2610]KAJ2378434.1 hypothetical protein H4S02_007368 [Coemansia sp. RSA 2611]
MYYHPALDGAPSSVSSTVVAIASSVTSMFGCAFMLARLRRLRMGRGWHTRHYMVFAMAVANLAMATTALVSGSVFLVYGRIASAAGCTIGGMIELWAQQAVDVCAVLTTVAALASQRHSAQWTSKQHWIQSNMAPVFGLIVFLPLVNTVVSQIVWRFRSSEHAFCWIPRMPVHARWIAVDGWRLLAICAIIAAYACMARSAWRVRRGRRMGARAGDVRSFSSSTCEAGRAAYRVRAAAIDSEPASHASDARGLFSQSMHNIQYWALSRLARSQPTHRGLRSLRPERRSAGSLSRLARAGPGSKLAADPAGMQGAPSYYYEQFKRSLGHIARWFAITTDIPSPTLAPSIFDRIGRDEADVLSSTTQCEFCSSRVLTPAESGSSESYRTSDLQVDMVDYVQPMRGLRRWCSAISRLAKQPSLQLVRLAQGARLRRSHTAPNVRCQDMGLCNCVFKKPRTPHVDTPQLTADQMTFAASMRKTDAVSSKIYEIFAHPLHTAVLPQPVSIYTCANTHINEPMLASTHTFAQRTDDSLDTYSNRSVPAELIGRPVELVEKPVELAEKPVIATESDGSWAAAVARCREERAEPRPRVSRLYVYPLAYVAAWLPSVVYCLVSTHVYYAAFHAMPLHARRSVDMSGLPAHWTADDNANRAWPYLQHAARNIPATGHLYWLAIAQSLHLLNGALDALLFWLTESQHA